MEILQNQYVMAALLAGLIVAILKIIDQWRDRRQKIAQKIAAGMREMGLVDLPEGFEAYARDGWEDFIRILHSMGERLSKPDGVVDALCEIYEKTFDKVLNNPKGKARLQPLVAKRILGFILDDATQAELIDVSHTLSDLGSQEISQIFSALGANNIDKAKAGIQALIALLRNRDRVDDVLMDRAKKTIPKLMEQPEHAAALRLLVNGPPSLDQQIAELQKKKTATAAAG